MESATLFIAGELAELDNNEGKFFSSGNPFFSKFAKDWPETKSEIPSNIFPENFSNPGINFWAKMMSEYFLKDDQSRSIIVLQQVKSWQFRLTAFLSTDNQVFIFNYFSIFLAVR